MTDDKTGSVSSDKEVEDAEALFRYMLELKTKQAGPSIYIWNLFK